MWIPACSLGKMQNPYLHNVLQNRSQRADKSTVYVSFVKLLFIKLLSHRVLNVFLLDRHEMHLTSFGSILMHVWRIFHLFWLLFFFTAVVRMGAAICFLWNHNNQTRLLLVHMTKTPSPPFNINAQHYENSTAPKHWLLKNDWMAWVETFFTYSLTIDLFYEVKFI